MGDQLVIHRLQRTVTSSNPYREHIRLRVIKIDRGAFVFHWVRRCHVFEKLPQHKAGEFTDSLRLDVQSQFKNVRKVRQVTEEVAF